MVQFSRSTAWTGSSLAYLHYRRTFTELNAQYWAGVPGELWSRRFAAEHDPSTSFQTAFGVHTPNWNHVALTVGDYTKKFATHRRWSTLTTLVLLTSTLENFITTIGETAVASDPFLTPGFPKRVDGAMLLKYGHSIPYSREEPLMKGAWPARLSMYKRLFGSVPNELTAQLSELEKMRILRNRVAHQFGFESDELAPRVGSLSSSLTHVRLLKWFAVADGVAKRVEEHLKKEYIGDFETLRLYHYWDQAPSVLLRRTGIKLNSKSSKGALGFRKFLGAYVGSTPGGGYVNDLESFYNQLK